MIKSNNFIFKKGFKRWRRNNDLITSIMHLFKGSNSLQKYKNGFQKVNREATSTTHMHCHFKDGRFSSLFMYKNKFTGSKRKLKHFYNGFVKYNNNC